MDCIDDLQCPDPTPVHGTLKVLYGDPYYLGCNVLLTCDPGLVFPDGEKQWNMTCEPIPVSPLQVIWSLSYTGQPTCKGQGRNEVVLMLEAAFNLSKLP